MKVKLLVLFFLSTVFIAGYIGFAVISQSDNLLHVIFCDVGQGDAIVITTPNKSHILVDGGPPNDKVHECLLKEIPFWRRKLDIVFLTHPHLDHLGGLKSVIKRYPSMRFDAEKLTNNTKEYTSLMHEVTAQKIPINYLYGGDSFKTKDGVSLRILGPSKAYLEARSSEIQEGEGFGNLIILITYGSTRILLTGDSQIEGMNEAVRHIGEVDVLQIPHHGSKTGIDQAILEKLKPKLAVISVGKNNYGHPSSSVISLLKDKQIPYLQTKERGSIEVQADLKEFTLQTEK